MTSVKNTLLLAFFVCLRVGDLGAQDDPPLGVAQIAPTLSSDSLRISARFQNVFSRKIVGTIQSGLPSIIHIEIELREGERNRILHRLLSRSISYDIWQERYSLTKEDTVLSFSDFERVRQVSSRLDDYFLTPIRSLNAQVRYRVRIRVAIIPISASQGAKVNDWLLDPNQTEEGFAAENRSSGFKFTLSNLISFFVRDRRSRYSSDWFRSDAFTLEQLK